MRLLHFQVVNAHRVLSSDMYSEKFNRVTKEELQSAILVLWSEFEN
jgi:hypothetical protein